ncbi:tetratricopeptide repeat protein [Methylotenera sp.]|uniref:tetratricopeptide repeat protein n=1 Tax=Methylotenera sp. TaxID=2051956 RepID=UPI002489E0CE|nr:tetratricopeptide repeat protein [Methylotenera sp.]MDI1299324.1 tetratricopeptide repeat protein [Methylotenera sp.]
MITSEGDIKSNQNTNNKAGAQSNSRLENEPIKARANETPTTSELNALAVMFNNGQLVESEQSAVNLTQRYPKSGFGWKVLGAVLQKKGMFKEASSALHNAASLLPKDSEAQYNLGNFFYDQQQFDDALKYYKNAIKLSPDFAKAHYNLGNVFKSQNHLEQASVSYKNALRIEPSNIQAACNLAQVFYEQENLNDSISYFKQALSIDEDFSVAHVGLGACFQAIGQLTEAEECFRKAINLSANDVEAQSNLGGVLKELGRLAEAESCYRAVLSITPENVDIYIKLASLLKSIGNSAESADCFAKALSINSLLEDAQNDLGLALADQGRFFEAEICYQNAIKIAPNFWKAHNNLGLTLHSLARFKEAEAAFEKAVELNPNEALIYSNLSLPLVAQGQIKKAEVYLKKAIEINPTYVNAYINLGTNYLGQGFAQEAEFAFLEALRFDQNSTKARSNLLFTLNYSGGHTAEYRLQQARQYGKTVDEKVNFVFTSWLQVSDVRRLRIGLVSGDLRQHPVAYFLENWAKYIDSSRFELIAYTTDSREDEVTTRLKPHFSGWRSLVGLNDVAAAELIHSNAIHILIDLSGHTAENRLPVFSYRPAPIQVSWLGYFATTGITSLDYFIADEVGVPEESKKHFVEKIKYVANTRLCFTPPSSLIDISPLPALTNGYITFASFQTLVKASGDVLALWAGVMQAVPNSKLRWQCKSFADSAVVKDLKVRFANYGINSDRLILLESVSRDAYFKAHAEVDMILDTFPYPGGTTTCEALWMGVPTLTLAGDTLIARQGASLMASAGLNEWVADNKTDYVSKALSFVSDITKLSKLRMQLREQVLASPLFDAPLFAKNMEILLLEMWNEKFPICVKQNSKQDETDLTSSGDADVNFTNLLNTDLVIVSSTKYTESEFWTKSPLGLSLPRHRKQDSRFTISITFESSCGLSEVFNASIDQAKEDAVLIFIHDNVWIDDANFADKILEGLTQYDVIGVAGNRRRVPNQPSWALLDERFIWDDSANLSGRIAHGENAFGEVEFFGDVPAECELLDGVFLATKKSTLKLNALRFDNQFTNDFYDMDFCRSVRAAGLRLGTWQINLTQQKAVSIGNAYWREKYKDYLNKWEMPSEVINTSEVVSSDSHGQTLQNAINDVFQMAVDHQSAGNTQQAEQLYQEILNIQPQHAAANHNLGIIEASSKGAVLALPRLELAVQSQPESEQFWVSYIDALMQTGAIETATDALELGQKFGLRPKTSQYIAAEFVKEFDRQAQRQEELRVSALDALQLEFQPRDKSLFKIKPELKTGKSVFYIWSPNYTTTSSGIKALHLLCDRLNAMGYEAYITAVEVNPTFVTPTVTKKLIEIHKQQGRLQIAFYPETQMGNPLLVPNVVRYLLNTPNFFAKTSWFGSFHKDELLLHYADAVAIPWIKSDSLRIQTIDRNIFKPLSNKQNADRSGFLVYSHRVQPDLDQIPSWCKPYQVISMEDPKSPVQLAELYQKAKGLIVYERTMAVIEAMLCGCPVMTCSQFGLSKSVAWYEGYDEVLKAWDFDQDTFTQVTKDMEAVGEIYEYNQRFDDQMINMTFNRLISHFQLDSTDDIEITPLYGIELAKDHLQKGQIKEAVMNYKQVIIDDPTCVEAYFRLGSTLMNVRLFAHALGVLKQGESYLMKLPDHKFLDSIRLAYYSMMGEACVELNELDVARNYFDLAAKTHD